MSRRMRYLPDPEMPMTMAYRCWNIHKRKMLARFRQKRFTP